MFTFVIAHSESHSVLCFHITANKRRRIVNTMGSGNSSTYVKHDGEGDRKNGPEYGDMKAVGPGDDGENTEQNEASSCVDQDNGTILQDEEKSVFLKGDMENIEHAEDTGSIQDQSVETEDDDTRSIQQNDATSTRQYYENISISSADRTQPVECWRSVQLDEDTKSVIVREDSISEHFEETSSLQDEDLDLFEHSQLDTDSQTETFTWVPCKLFY